jgi:hypothetical protein
MAAKKPQTVPIDSVISNRVLLDNDDISELAASIDKTGLKRPILLDEKLQLIDGLRRYEAMQKLGWDRVPVIISKTLEESCEAIAKTRLHGEAGFGALPVTPRRCWEVFTDLTDQARERSTRLRRRRVGLKRGEPLPNAEEIIRSRVMIGEALGFKGEAFLAASTAVYKAFVRNNDPEKVEGLANIRWRLEAGQLSLYEARGAVDRLGKADMSGDIITINEQRNALASALSQLTGVTKGVARIGEPSAELNQTELKLYIKGFEDSRRDLQRFINSLKKRVTE